MDDQQREEQIRQRVKAVSPDATYIEYTDGDVPAGWLIESRGREVAIFSGAGDEQDEANAVFFCVAPSDIGWLLTQLAHQRQRAAQYRAGLIGIANEAVLQDEPTIRHLADAALTTTEEADDGS